MKTTTKILIRNILRQLPIFLSTVAIVALSATFFVAVKTLYKEYDRIGQEYFENNELYDGSFLGIFTEKDLEKVSFVEGVAKVDIKHRFDAKIKNFDSQLILYSVYNESEKSTDEIIDDRLNLSYVHEGKDTYNLADDEIALNKKYADAHDLKIGDSITIDFYGFDFDFTIASLISMPNYVFLFKDRSITVSKASEFAIGEVNEIFFEDNYMPYDAIYVTYDDSFDVDQTHKNVRLALGENSLYDEHREQSANYMNYLQVLEQIDTFAYLCPLILLFMEALLLFVIQRRNVSVQRTQIGVMKAIGLTDFQILFLYMKNSVIISILGIIVGFAAVNIALPPVFNSLNDIFNIPNLKYSVIYWDLWMITLLIILVVSLLANFFAALSILHINPAQSIRGEVVRSGKKIFIESFKFWQSLSFNTRYTVKNIFRGKARYFASVWAMFVAITITLFAQGFNDSFAIMVQNIYGKFALYDINISTEPMEWEQNPSFLNEPFVASYDKVAFYRAKLYNNDNSNNSNNSLDSTLLIYDSGFSALNLNIDNLDSIDNGVILPSSLAKRLNVIEGDYIDIEIYVGSTEKIVSVVVAALVEQQGMFFVYMPKGYAIKEFGIDNEYRALYVKTDDTSIFDIEQVLDSDEDVFSYSFRAAEQEAYTLQISTTAVLVNILVIVAFILGALSLYGIGVVTLATRRYEFTLLKVMGYTTKEIMLSFAKENILQTILAIPLGLIACNFVLNAVKGSFSNTFFDFIPHISTGSYISAFALLFSVILFVAAISGRYISELDMVEGLKEGDE